MGRLLFRSVVALLGLAGAVLGSLALLLFVAMPAYFNPKAPPPNYPPPSNAAEAKRQDLDYLKYYLKFDRSFSPPAREHAEAARKGLMARAEALTDAEFVIGISRLAALSGNGHSSFNPAKPKTFGFLPIRIWKFEDGFYITRARREVREILGAQILSVDGHAIDDVYAAVAPLIAGTDEFKRSYSLSSIEVPALLHALGMAQSEAGVTLGLKLADGRQEHRQLTVLPVDENRPWAPPMDTIIPAPIDGENGLWATLLDPAGQLPLWLRDGNVLLRAEPLQEGQGYYIQYRINQDYAGQSIGRFQSQLRSELKDHKPRFVVVDMRFNGGGDYTTTWRFLTDLPRLLPEARFYILTSPETFSAGITSTVFLKGAAGDRAMIIGEHVGDRASFWGEGNFLEFPNSKYHIRYATGFHSYDGHCGLPDKCYWVNYIFRPYVKSIAPDLRVPLTFADYFSGRDPVLDRVLELEASRS